MALYWQIQDKELPISCITKLGESDYLCFDLVQIVSEIVNLV